MSVCLGEIETQLLTISAALPQPVLTQPVRPHQNQRHLVPVAAWAGGGVRAGGFSLKFQGKYP